LNNQQFQKIWQEGRQGLKAFINHYSPTLSDKLFVYQSSVFLQSMTTLHSTAATSTPLIAMDADYLSHTPSYFDKDTPFLEGFQIAQYPSPEEDVQRLDVPQYADYEVRITFLTAKSMTEPTDFSVAQLRR
jgi:hypothetical protein